MGAPRFVMDDFWPSDLFLGGIPGAWYDPTDLSTMFQDSTGTTPVTAVEQPVGLILDKSQGLALGSDIVVNGNFASAAGWLTPGSWTIGSGVATASGGGYLYRTLAAVSGYKVFRVTFDLVTRTAGSVQAYMHNGTTAVFTPAVSAPGSYSFVLAHTNVNELGFLATALTGSVDNLSIRELAGNHASQSTAASRPTYRARYNLLTFSEQFDDASWSKLNVAVTSNATIAPDGTTTADRITAAAGASSKYVGGTPTASGQTAFSFYVKAGTHGIVQLLNTGDAQAFANFDVTTGTIGSVGTKTTATIQNVGSGWFRCVATFSATTVYAAGWRLYQAPSLASGYAPSWTTAGTETTDIWGAQLLTAADVTATGDAYQRIAAATVYDTSPIFRPYLAFDGMDDSLATAAIDFTSTDKMTVFGGVTKFVDAIGVITELSADKNANNGVFFFNTDAAPRWYWSSKGTVEAGANSGAVTTFPAPSTSVVTNTGDISAPLSAIRVNGVFRSSSALTQGTGNYGNYPLFIGRRNNASLPFNGRLYSIIVRGAASSVTEIADTELWVNARTGGY